LAVAWRFATAEFEPGAEVPADPRPLLAAVFPEVAGSPGLVRAADDGAGVVSDGVT